MQILRFQVFPGALNIVSFQSRLVEDRTSNFIVITKLKINVYEMRNAGLAIPRASQIYPEIIALYSKRCGSCRVAGP